MTTHSAHILKEALALSPVERAELIDELYASFDHHHDHAVDDAWAREALHRSEEIDSGTRATFPLHEVLDELKPTNPR